MEFRIEVTGPSPDVDAISEAIRLLDPSAVADLEPGGGALRIATMLDGFQLSVAVSNAGLPVRAVDVVQLASTCCGGCSG